MDIKEHTQPHMLERYAFLWSEARLLVAAVALFLGGVPPVYYLLGSSVYGILSLFWIISGAASAYLLYMWHTKGRKLFGRGEQKDTIAFFVSVVSGINLGLAGLLSRNIGMSITMNKTVFLIVGVLYLLAAWHLWTRWKASGEKLF